MNSLHNKNVKSEIYSTSGFRDTLASPVFYPVIVVSLVLGIASIFGFVQNPLKLKAMVNVIHQKVAETKVVNDSFKNDLYVLTNRSLSENKSSFEQQTNNLELFSSLDQNAPEKTSVTEGFERIAFNYDITSDHFWSGLDSSTFESATEEIQRKERESTTFGVPIEIDYQDNYPAEFNLEDDSIYALNNKSTF